MPFVIEKRYRTHWSGPRHHFVLREYTTFVGFEVHFVSPDRKIGMCIGRVTPTELSLNERRFRYFRRKQFRSNSMTIQMSRSEFWNCFIPWANRQKVKWSARPKKLFERHRSQRGYEYGRIEYVRGGYSVADIYIGPTPYAQQMDWIISFEKTSTSVFFYMNIDMVLGRDEQQKRA